MRDYLGIHFFGSFEKKTNRKNEPEDGKPKPKNVVPKRWHVTRVKGYGLVVQMTPLAFIMLHLNACFFDHAWLGRKSEYRLRYAQGFFVLGQDHTIKFFVQFVCNNIFGAITS